MTVACQQKVQVDPSLQSAFPELTFEKPIEMQNAGDGSNRLFIGEKAGRIYGFINNPKTKEKTLLLDITDRVYNKNNNGGLLSFTFHPQFKENGFFFVHYLADNPRRRVISRFTFKEGGPIAKSEKVFLQMEISPSNNNGGQLLFGPDGMLYISMGDDAYKNEGSENAQNPKSLLGKILRIDVEHPSSGRAYSIPKDNPFVGGKNGFKEEILAYGFRNPWKCSFDPARQRYLWCGDIGEHQIEEINVIFPGGNYGWNLFEGRTCILPDQCPGKQVFKPIITYDHEMGNAVIGGMVYRSTRRPELWGHYIYGDFNSGTIWAVQLDNDSNPVKALTLAESGLKISAFGRDEDGEIYIVSYSGQIYKFTD